MRYWEVNDEAAHDGDEDDCHNDSDCCGASDGSVVGDGDCDCDHEDAAGDAADDDDDGDDDEGESELCFDNFYGSVRFVTNLVFVCFAFLPVFGPYAL